MGNFINSKARLFSLATATLLFGAGLHSCALFDDKNKKKIAATLLYSNVKALAFAHLKDLRTDISRGIIKTKDQDTKIHLQYLKQMLDKIVEESPIPGLNY
ncbi:hypothetical protein LPB86_09100 [Pedobacter sp. MC2016-14]|uniref:hypothetical protein n=1 Tax=Pedobacter sp. MC2016-14 TaxID=2897327 RepID=UPI001E47F15C|nr:hypothetical protein [Pedobacter sp. MC2016-14]MCD0488386.1 hypothetical protein [Pedobacter sp. MC2016-14]